MQEWKQLSLNPLAAKRFLITSSTDNMFPENPVTLLWSATIIKRMNSVAGGAILRAGFSLSAGSGMTTQVEFN